MHILIRTIICALAFVGGLAGLQGPRLAADAQTVESAEKELVIGVIANRGADKALARWSATADYLSESMEGYRFRALPLPVSGLAAAVADGSVNFLILNPGAYVELADAHGISSLSTLVTRWGKDGADTFGSVVFAPSARDDLLHLEDIKGKRFVAVAPESFGGFQTTWREFEDLGFDIQSDFSTFEFTGFPQDAVVRAVLDGKFDAGTVRTGILEKMILEGQIKRRDFKIIGQLHDPNFPLLVSSRLYPEWAFARTSDTSSEISRNVLRALLNLQQGHPAAVAGHYVGWSTPASYSGVRSLFRELQIGPYEGSGEISLAALWQQYSEWILLISLAVVLLVINNIIVRRAVIAREHAQEALEARSGELKKSNEALEAARSRADQSNQAKSEFLSRMSHELRTPMNSIIGFTGIIKDGIAGPVTAEQTKQLEMVYGSARHLLSLINDVLDISKIEAGKAIAAAEIFALHPLLSEVSDLVKPLAEAKDLELLADFEKAPEYIKSDPDKLRQVLVNLLGNAIKFTAQGSVTLHCSQDSEGIHIAVHDTGAGIDATDQEHIFEAFHQVDGADDRQQDGSGLGLAISKQFAELLGGHIQLTSEPAIGSTFTIHLPADLVREMPNSAMATRQSTVAAVPRMVVNGIGSRTVLVVDDQPEALELMRQYLEREGYEVLLCDNGKDAIELARKHQPIAITLDIMMPDPDGWSTMEQLKSDSETRRIPVIMVSCLDEENLGLSMGAVDYLRKPVEADDLRASLQNLLLSGNNILVLDDHERDGALLQDMLKPEGFNVAVFSDGAAALAHVESAPVDLILLDLIMPGMNGFEFIRRLQGSGQTQNRQIPIIVVSAKSLTDAEEEYLSTAVRSILVKGEFDSKGMLAEVGTTLSSLRAAPPV